MDASPHPETGAGSAPRRRRVLVVEDDPDAALYTAHVLGKQGRFEVAHTADPAAAMVMAAGGAADLVVTDLDLPVMSGLELAAALRRVAPGLPVILLTSYPPGTWPAGRPRDGRPDAVLVKPVPPGDLLAAVRALIGGRSPGTRP